MRHYFEDEFDLSECKNIEKWKKMWEELAHDNTFILDTIVPLAKDRRHGRSVSVTGEERGKIFEEAWIVIAKFLDYLIKRYDPDRLDVQFV